MKKKTPPLSIDDVTQQKLTVMIAADSAFPVKRLDAVLTEGAVYYQLTVETVSILETWSLKKAIDIYNEY